jgi:MFS transporter, MHS family, shikimate and dehydroshikimate transport protein
VYNPLVFRNIRRLNLAAAMSEQAEPIVDTRTLVILAFSATAGVLVEFYDFLIYGFAAATAFPSIFFPKLPPIQALVLSYLAFGAGFPARLLGAFIFGHFGDRAGRKIAFVTNILIVGVTTCLTGLLPGYAKLGISAPVILVLLRIVQGIGLGGEFGGASALLAEFGAKRRSRAFWTSLANLGIPLGFMSASSAMLVLNKSFATTGWRVAMLLSAIIVIPALVARYKLADSPLFEHLKQREQLARAPSLAVFQTHARSVILVAGVLAFMQMDAYVSGTYAISFMNFAGIPLATTASVLLLSRIFDALGVILSGPLADLLKRKLVAYSAIAITTLLSYPFAFAILSRRILLVTILQFSITFFGVGLLHGLAPILTSENFPTKFRYSGAGISYSLSAVLGGMIAPSVLAGLVGNDVLHKWFYMPVVYSVYCAAAMLSLLFMRETRNISLDDLDRKMMPVSDLKAEEAVP